MTWRTLAAVGATMLALSATASAADAAPPTVGSPAASNVTAQSATLTGIVNANGQGTNYFFEYGPTPSYGGYSASGGTWAGSSASPVSVSTAIGGLSAGATYHFRVVAYNASGETFSADASFTAIAASNETASSRQPTSELGTPSPFTPGLGATSPLTAGGRALAVTPVIGRVAGVRPVSGTILVRDPSSGTFVPLGGARAVPIGAVIDVSSGVVRLLTALDTHGRTQAVTVWGGVLQIAQSRSDGGLTRLILKGALPSCARGARAHMSRANSRRVRSRKLWAQDEHGRYTSFGAYSATTVLGTKWETVDTCAGTVTRVASGEVRVRDLRRGKTVLVSAGHSYLARP